MIKIKLNEFYDFSKGVPVEDKEILKWLEESRQSLLESDNEFDFTFHASGNTIVIGFKFASGEYEFIVADSYRTLDNYDTDKRLEQITFLD